MEDKKTIKDHNVFISNRKKITLTNVTKALSANQNGVVLQLVGYKAQISGNNLHISKLDMEQGVAEVEGEINGLKYVGANEAGGFFKKLIK